MKTIQADVNDFIENLKTLPVDAPCKNPIVMDLNPYYPGVDIPEYIREGGLDPSITLILYRDYEDLKITSDSITVTLLFGDADTKYKVTIPVKSLLGYYGKFPNRFDGNVLDFQSGKKRSVH